MLNNVFHSYFMHFDVISDGSRLCCAAQNLSKPFLSSSTSQQVRLSEEKEPAGAHPFELGNLAAFPLDTLNISEID